MINLEKERELFELEAKKYEDCDLSKNEDESYKSDLTHSCFYWWCKSANRDGFKLVPIEAGDDLAEKLLLPFNTEDKKIVYKEIIRATP